MDEQERKDELEAETGDEVDAHLFKETIAAGVAAAALAGAAQARPVQPPDVGRAAEPAQLVTSEVSLPNAQSTINEQARVKPKKAHTGKSHKAKKAHKSAPAPKIHVGRNPNLHEG